MRVDTVSLAELLGLNVGAAWTLFWTLFFVRLVLGFAVGFDSVVLSFRRPTADQTAVERTKADAKKLRSADNAIFALHNIVLVLFFLVWPFLPR